MNRPYFASRNQARRASFAGSGSGAWAAPRQGAGDGGGARPSGDGECSSWRSHPFCFRRASASATQPRRSFSAGTPDRYGLMSRSGVPSSMSTPRTRSRGPSRPRSSTTETPIGLGRRGERDAKTPCGVSSVERHLRDELVALRAVEHPDDEEVREALDVLEPRLELRPQLERALGVVLRAGALRDLGLVAVRAEDAADRPHLDDHGVLAHEMPPARDEGTISRCGSGSTATRDFSS